MKVIDVQGFTPHKKQREIIQSAQSDEIKYIVVNTGRQFGKSFMGMNLILKWQLEHNKSVGMYVTPVYAQAKKVFSELVSSLGNSSLTTEINKSELHIRFINGSVLYFRSAEREDSLRGYTLDYLVVDEAAYIKDVVWDTVLRPTTLVRGKKCLFLSTPKGRNWFYNMAMKGMSEEYPNYITFRASSFDTPFISEEELNEAKKTLPEAIYRQEILAEFIDDGGEVFSNLKNRNFLNQYPPYNSSEKYYAGVDLGRANDYSVLTILNSQGMVVEIYRERQKSWDVIVSEMLVVLRKYKPQLFVEINNQGDVVYEMIRKGYSAAQPFTTTNDSKQNIIEDLILALNEDKLILPSETLNPDLYREMSQFTYEYSPKTRKVRYASPNGLHDDMVISLALANHALKKKINYGKYVII